MNIDVVKAGDRIAQLIIKIITPEVIKVADVDLTVRGAGGFGLWINWHLTLYTQEHII